MPRVFLPLLPIPVLAVVAAFSACGSREEPATRLIPPAVALAPAAAAPIGGPSAAPVAAAPVAEDAPSPEEVRAFERPVAK